MSDDEFDVLDELYFINDFSALQDMTGMEEVELKSVLLRLLEKGWVNALKKDTEDTVSCLDNFNKNYKFYNYVATKEGLLAHNGR